MRTSTLRKLLLNAFVVVQLAGCIPIPNPVPIPIEEPEILDKLSHLQPGVTTQDEVRSILGPPGFEFPEERIWVYQDQARHIPALFIAEGQGPTLSDYITEILFDANNMVTVINTRTRSAISKTYGFASDVCLPSGICELRGWYRKILAPPTADQRAKEFTRNTHTCAIYVYGDEIDDNIGDMLSVDGDRYYLSNEGFSLILCPPGRHKIRNIGSGNYEHNLNCVAGDVIFLNVRMTQHAPFGKGYSPTLEQVREDVGRVEVTKRRLIARPTTSMPIGAHPLFRGWNSPSYGSKYIDP